MAMGMTLGIVPVLMPFQSLSFLFNAKPFKIDCIRFHCVYSVENVVSTPIDTKVGAG